MKSAEAQRYPGIDAARGGAMLLVCLSHFGLEYFRAVELADLQDVLYRIGMVASPTFVAISGVMLGLMQAGRSAEQFRRVRRSLLERGLFLLTVGHVLIMLACVPRSGSLHNALPLGFMTDAVGLSIILGPLVVPRIAASWRAAIGAALLVLNWVLIVGWEPTHHTTWLKHVFTGPFPDPNPNTFALVAWFGVYLAATALGSCLWSAAHRGLRPGAERRLMLLGAGMAVAVAAMKLAIWTGRDLGLLASHADPHALAQLLSSPWQKAPPAPAYLVFFGGCGLLLLGSVMLVSRRSAARPVVEWLAFLGRNSLFLFIAQFYVYYLGFHFLRLAYTPLWPLYFAASVGLLTAAARAWSAHDGNRLLTLPVIGASSRVAAWLFGAEPGAVAGGHAYAEPATGPGRRR